MSGNNAEIDRFDLSRACIEYVADKLKQRGVRPKQELIARELGVGQSMISQASKADSQKPLSYRAIATYANKQKMGLGEFCFELIKLIPAPNMKARKLEVKRFDAQEFLSKTFKHFERISRVLSKEKACGECNAEKFYQKIVTFAFCLLYKSGFNPLATGLFFAHNGYLDSYISHRKHTRAHNVKLAGKRIPQNIRNILHRSWAGKRLPNLLKDFTVTRPPKANLPESEHFWQDLTGREAGDSGERLKIYVGRVYLKESVVEDFQGGTYSINMLFLFEHGFQAPNVVCQAMVLLAELARCVYSFELEAHVESVTTLIGTPLLPADIRPHSNYYRYSGGRYTSVPGKLEATVQSFFDELMKNELLRKVIVAAEIWSYDWTKGKFVNLSPYFQYINPSYSKVRVLVNGRTTSLAEVYKKPPAKLSPPPYGLTCSILISRKATYIHGGVRNSSFGNGKEPSHVFKGTLIGVPLIIADRTNDRVIHNVLYIHCAVMIDEPEELVKKMAKIAKAKCKDIKMIVSAVERKSDGFSDAEFGNMTDTLRAMSDSTSFDTPLTHQ